MRSGSCFSLREAFFFAPRAGSGRSGWASSPALRPACACDRAGTSRGGAPRCSYEATPAIPHRETPARDPRAPARWLLHARGAILTTTPSARNPATGNEQLSCARPAWASGRGERYRRCRGWPITPEPAGSGRASRVGETAAQLYANAEGPRCGSRPPVAGGGVCGCSDWGDARPHPATRGTGKKEAVTQ